ncbi:hypothetical protein [cf. Phormidesmis sp. LEGE 11477]|uniref:hypothetical protein n=1 Tax=cf. Phormidesmis sp. LEGE 11477 TaxID=1828680 RepID=UPI00187EF5AD|nr:hypothetical protein [cf. Phormidesmis sp. LEGE 11477]MBE9061506.1 hypothetical protein [cf. Phormidesmis sp. LEGE 11477]
MKKFIFPLLMIQLGLFLVLSISACQQTVPPQPSVSDERISVRGIPISGSEDTESAPVLASPFDASSLDASSKALPRESLAEGESSLSVGSSTPSVGTVTSIYDRLVEGDFFHTIPTELKVEEPIVIKAGIADEVTKEILDSLDIDEPISLEEITLYNPLNVELRLVGNPDMFLIEDISAGRKAVVANDADVWRWSVTPLLGGSYSLTLESTLSLDFPNSIGREQRLLLAERPIQVRGSSISTLRLSFRRYWQIYTLVLSAVLIGFVTRLLSKRHYQKKFSAASISQIQ